MEIMTGVALLAATYLGFMALRPTAAGIHPLMRKEMLGTCLVLGLVAALSIGSAFLIHGVVRYF
ncbi:MAG: hypothetical protein APF80_11110 [Alphaproteobacteria bacterium BRH_c36]|nr:MAG: hypothetical protein APF80_11110 [Alphaproteobacteria bacterium BRH_c36]